MNIKQQGLIKIIAGIALSIGGILGLVFGKGVKQRALRIAVMIMSCVSITGGAYLFVLGVDDTAIGQVGDYQMGQSGIQEMVYASPQDFKNGLKEAFKYQPDLRRLKFQCPDKSKEITVYNTFAGMFGVPDKELTCNDGFKLLSFVQ